MNKIAQICILAFGWRRLLIMFIAGAICALSMPPWFYLPTIFVTLPLWVWCLDGAERPTGWGRVFGPAFQIGFSFALGYFATSLHWIGAAFYVDGGWLLLAMPFAVLAIAGVLSVFWGLASALAHQLWSPAWGRVIVLALALSAAEFARGHLFTGFPFNLLGYALTANETMMQSASIVGIYGLTLLAALVGFLPALIWPQDERSLAARLFPLFAIVSLLAVQLSYGQYRLTSVEITQRPDMRLRLVQPGISQVEKWQPGNAQFVLDRLISLSQSRTNPDNTGLIGITHLIWPEAALPFFLTDYPQALVKIAQMLPEGTSLLMGAPRRESGLSSSQSEYNSILVIDAAGEILSSYDKTHLVPVGEYLPFQSTLKSFGINQFVTANKGWSAGESRHLMQTNTTPPFLPLICYEAIFSGSMGEEVDAAQYIVNLTNDAWFDKSIGPAQHFHHARLRAVEHGLPMIRVANTGKSAIIDPLGRLTGSMEPGQTGLIDGTMPQRLAPTLFSRYLNLPFLLVIGFGFVIIFFTHLFRSRT